MKEIYRRSHMCGAVSTADIGSNITLNGWIQKRRDHGSLIFCDLRDKTGIVQIVFNEEIPKELFAAASKLRSEYVVGVKGIVKERVSKNKELATGDIEVFVDAMNIYSEADIPPIYVKDDDNVDENLRLKYRYLDLRKNKMQRNLSFRHQVVKVTRDYFDEQGFTEIETPVLIKPTPEGARDYLVPSRVKPGHFYALPQSPQMFKQLLMAGGTDRYLQIAKCFRDEDLRADRQPEFTQIDLEMSFVDVDDVLAIQEGFIKRLFRDVMDIDIETPLPRYSYNEAMERFGSDKPDTRFGFELVSLNQEVDSCGFQVFTNVLAAGGDVKGININGGADRFSRKEIDKLQDMVKAYGAKGLAWIKIEEGGINSPIAKFINDSAVERITDKMRAKPGDLLFIVADKAKVVYDSLGFLRREIAGRLGLLDDSRFNLLWVVDFPLLEYDQDEQRYFSVHHPFTSPNIDDLELLDISPDDVRAKAYDIVMNGVELGGGSIRIHDSGLQAKMFEILGFSQEESVSKFGFLLEAFKYGVPPHGGIAYGLDRLVMLLLGEQSIREVMAFPKNQMAVCPVSGAPGIATEEQLSELGLLVNQGQSQQTKTKL